MRKYDEKTLFNSDISVSKIEIEELLKYYSQNSFDSVNEDPVFKHSVKKCINLLEHNYSLVTVRTSYGNFTTRYPDKLIILQCERSISQNAAVTTSSSSEGTSLDTIGESEHGCDVHGLQKLFNKARFARCQMRFPVPVILYNKKFVCRSATLAGAKEIRHRSELYYIICPPKVHNGTNNAKNFCDRRHRHKKLPDWELLDYVRRQDIKLLEVFNVGIIIDLMLEKTKDKILCTERSDKEERYLNFNIISLPYPRVAYFQLFRDNNYSARNIVYNWSEHFVDKKLSIPRNIMSSGYGINWNNFKKWDLVQLTCNYMELILKYFQAQNSGILIHCISGWDRTPLFISLLRISLWADGLVHKGLDVCQLLYLTITYDWILFGHDLNARHSTGRDIFVFCFYMLKYLTDQKYSLLWQKRPQMECSEYVDSKSDTSSSGQRVPLCAVKMDTSYFLRKRTAPAYHSTLQNIDEYPHSHKRQKILHKSTSLNGQSPVPKIQNCSIYRLPLPQSPINPWMDSQTTLSCNK